MYYILGTSRQVALSLVGIMKKVLSMCHIDACWSKPEIIHNPWSNSSYYNAMNKAKKEKACSTSYSQAVTHPSARSLIQVPGRPILVNSQEPVFLLWYGHRQYLQS